ncbi:uncharacterized protein LOC144452195 isoform X1 [Glandiceps talaboti]
METSFDHIIINIKFVVDTSRRLYTSKMSFLLKKQAESWLLLKKQIDMFVKKTNLEVGVVVSFYDKVLAKRKFIVHGTDCMQQSLQEKLPDMVIPPVTSTRYQRTATDETDSSDVGGATDNSTSVPIPDLPDIRDSPQGCLSKLTFAELRHLIPTIVKTSVGRNQALWGNQDKAPMWWPVDVPYCNPCKRPKEVDGWTELLRRAAKACYVYYQREDLTGDNTAEQPQLSEENPTFTNAATPEDIQFHPEIPALQQIVYNYTTLNQNDLELLNMHSTPETLHVLPSAMEISTIPSFEDSTLHTNDSLSFHDTFQVTEEASLQDQTQSDDQFGMHSHDLSEHTVSYAIQSPSQPMQSSSSMLVRRSQRKSKKTTRALEYVMQIARRRR